MPCKGLYTTHNGPGNLDSRSMGQPDLKILDTFQSTWNNHLGIAHFESNCFL